MIVTRCAVATCCNGVYAASQAAANSLRVSCIQFSLLPSADWFARVSLSSTTATTFSSSPLLCETISNAFRAKRCQQPVFLNVDTEQLVCASLLFSPVVPICRCFVHRCWPLCLSSGAFSACVSMSERKRMDFVSGSLDSILQDLLVLVNAVSTCALSPLFTQDLVQCARANFLAPKEHHLLLAVPFGSLHWFGTGHFANCLVDDAVPMLLVELLKAEWLVFPDGRRIEALSPSESPSSATRIGRTAENLSAALRAQV
jgi:hypothetical protein